VTGLSRGRSLFKRLVAEALRARVTSVTGEIAIFLANTLQQSSGMTSEARRKTGGETSGPIFTRVAGACM
jgi:hypothetical protein